MPGLHNKCLLNWQATLWAISVWHSCNKCRIWSQTICVQTLAQFTSCGNLCCPDYSIFHFFGLFQWKRSSCSSFKTIYILCSQCQHLKGWEIIPTLCSVINLSFSADFISTDFTFYQVCLIFKKDLYLDIALSLPLLLSHALSLLHFKTWKSCLCSFYYPISCHNCSVEISFYAYFINRH